MIFFYDLTTNCLQTRMSSLTGVLFLALIGMHLTDASVKKFEDNTMQLIAPWTDAEHSLACPSQDPRPCPVLSMNAPVISVAVPSETVLIRQVASLSASEIQQGATTPFFLCNYMYFSAFGGKQYAVHDGPEQVMLTFETIRTAGRSRSLHRDFQTLSNLCQLRAGSHLNSSLRAPFVFQHQWRPIQKSCRRLFRVPETQ